MAEFMGVGEKYLKVVKKEWFLACAIPLATVKETVFQYEKDIESANVVSQELQKDLPNIFGNQGSVSLTTEEQKFIMNSCLPYGRYRTAKYEYRLGGLVPFTNSFADKWGSIVIIETKNGTKFGAFTKKRMSFPNGVLDSHIDDKAVLFNISTKTAFPY